jgi:hypothetical protein
VKWAKTGQWKQRSATNWVIVGVSVVLFVNSTLNLVVALITIYQAFVLYKGPGGPDHIFMHGSGRVCAIFVTSLLRLASLNFA